MKIPRLPDVVRCPACGSEPLERCWNIETDRAYLERGKTAYHPERIAALEAEKTIEPAPERPEA